MAKKKSDILVDESYKLERETKTGVVCSGGVACNDTVVRTVEWTGKIGLMYLSDYGYATGGSTTNRASCLLDKWTKLESCNCYNNNWLYNANVGKWTMTPAVVDSIAGYAFLTRNDIGNVNPYSGYFADNLLPTTYLKASTIITSGDGTSSSPFKIELS